MSLNVDYSEQELSLWCVGVTAIVRVTLKDGSYHENVGFAESRNENKGVAIQEAKMVRKGEGDHLQKAVMNARQQSLRLFLSTPFFSFEVREQMGISNIRLVSRIIQSFIKHHL